MSTISPDVLGVGTGAGAGAGVGNCPYLHNSQMVELPPGTGGTESTTGTNDINVAVGESDIATGSLVQDSHARYIAEGVPRDRCPYADHHEVILTLDEDEGGEGERNTFDVVEEGAGVRIEEGAPQDATQIGGTDTLVHVNVGCSMHQNHESVRPPTGTGTTAETSDMDITGANIGKCPMHQPPNIPDACTQENIGTGAVPLDVALGGCPMHEFNVVNENASTRTNNSDAVENQYAYSKLGVCPIQHSHAVHKDIHTDTPINSNRTNKCPFHEGAMNEVPPSAGECPINHDMGNEISHTVGTPRTRSESNNGIDKENEYGIDAKIGKIAIEQNSVTIHANKNTDGQISQSTDRTGHCPFHQGAISQVPSGAGKCPINHNAIKETFQSKNTPTASNSIVSNVSLPLGQSLVQQRQPELQQKQCMNIQQQYNQQKFQDKHQSHQHPRKVSEARQQMDALISAQKTAGGAVEQAREQLRQAQRNLELAEMRQKQLGEQITVHATNLTSLLLQEESNWNSMFQKLTEYKKKHGHCDVKRVLSREEREKDPELARLSQWVGRVRLEARRPVGHPERIDPYKIVALESIGFDFSPRDSTWMKNYEELKTYMIENNGAMPNKRKHSLGVWCNGQIFEFNKWQAGNPSYMTQRKIDLLNDIGFVWDRNSSAWMKRWEALKAFHAKHSHCRIPKDCEDQVLYRWVTKERIKYRNFVSKKKPHQSEEQWKLLKSIGFMDGKRPCSKKRKRKNANEIDRIPSISSPLPVSIEDS